MIPYGRQEITSDDIEAVVEVLRSDLITQGPVVPQFEQAVGNYCGAAHAVAVSSGTAGLHLACRSLDVGPGDLVWTTPITFVASANCARWCGADVDFVDIDSTTVNLNPERLEEKLKQTQQSGGRLPKVIIPVHFAGQPCEMVAISRLAEEYGFRIIEDASHAIGGRYKEEPVGSCRYSDITVFSFHPVKIITTGEGGMAVTNKPDLAERMDRLRSHGVTRDPEMMVGLPDGPWYYEQIELGFNYRMTEMQAALGASQLRRLDAYITRRNELAARYDEALSSGEIRPVSLLGDAHSAYHLYVVRVPEMKRRRVFEQLRDAAIGVNVHYIPLYLHPDFRVLGFEAGHCPEAECYYREAISLPIFPAITDAEQEAVIARLEEALEK